ncbi:SurA N-terminal domain-containing protein [Sphingomonas sp. H39-1-10]|uniref:peptidylprolyl isomerase n=1 Tax=Sphingomonas pollutisoli TaxID=3030829 RepID=UPI0023B94847|nr:peptidylprolyl isomerase [Sphingomonas pollutisoli]MDF0487250.1 SurA N-terminal domain-containing protein [Sphingomonas pollutisoli]
MLSFFRRIINSKVGVVVTLAGLIVIALMFGLTDITGLTGGGGATGLGESLATVGGTKIGANDIRSRAQRELEGYRQQNPTLDMAQFVAGGGVDGTLNRMIDTIALERFGHKQGMFVSDRLVDGRIASIPSLQGPDGKFSQDAYDRALKQAHQTDAALRADMKQGMIAQLLVTPLQADTPQVPRALALTYAGLLLEKRHAQIAAIPAGALATGPAPTDAELAAYYKTNAARYSVPERRTIRYATVSGKALTTPVTVSDAEIAAAYQAQIAGFRAVQRRTVVRVIVGDAASANALAAKIKAGTPIDQAARAAGLEPATMTALEKSAIAAQTSPAFADAVFAAAKGSVVGPVKGTLGYVVGRVESIDDRGEIPLAQAKAQLTEQLTTQKKNDQLRKIHDALDDAISNRATFDQLVSQQKLTPQVSPPVLASGVDPAHPDAKVPPAAKAIVDAGFASQPGDTPQLVPVDADSFAIVATAKVFPSAPPPLAEIRDAVARDFTMERAAKAARAVAKKVMDAANTGTPLAQAVAAAGVKLPPVQPLDKTRAEITANPAGVPAPLAMLFSMAPHTAKIVAVPNNAGWFVLWLDRIDKGDARGRPDIVAATQADIGKATGGEYIQQFVKAVRGTVGVKTDAIALAKLKAALTGQETTDQP